MIFFTFFTLIFTQQDSSLATCTEFCGAGTGVLPASKLNVHGGEICADAVHLTKEDCLQQQKVWISYTCGDAERWFLTQTEKCEDYQTFYRTSTPCCSTVSDPPACCKAATADCLSCSAGMSKEEYCQHNPLIPGCPSLPSCMRIPTGQFDVWGRSDGESSAMTKVATQNVMISPTTPCEGTANVLTNDGKSIDISIKVTLTHIEAKYVEPDSNSIEDITGFVEGDMILWSNGYTAYPVGQVPPEAKFDLMYALDKAFGILESIIKDHQVTRTEVVDFLVGQNNDLYLGFDQQFIREKANAVFTVLESQTDSDSDIIAESDLKELHEQIVDPARRYQIVDELLNALRLTDENIRMIFGVLDRNGNLEISAADFIHYVQTHFHMTELPGDLEMHINNYVELWFSQYSFDYNMVSSMINAGFDCAHDTITSLIDSLVADQDPSDVFFDFIQCIHDKTGLSKKTCEQSVFIERLNVLDDALQSSCHAAMDGHDDPVSDCACFNYLLDGDLDIECFWEVDNRETLRQHAENLCRSERPQPGLPYEWKDWTKENPPMGPVRVEFSMDEQFIEVSNYPCRTHGQDPDMINTRYYPAGKIDDRFEAYRSDNQQWWMIYETNCGGNGDHPPAWYLTPKSPDFSRTDNLEGRQDGGCTNTMRIEIPYESSFPTTQQRGVFMCDACMPIPTGDFDVYDSTGNVVGKQNIMTTGHCSGTATVDTMDGKHLPYSFKVTMTDVLVEHYNTETLMLEQFTGNVMGDGFEWSNGYASKRSGPMPHPPSQPCMAIPLGHFDVFDNAGSVVGSQEIHMTGPCTGTANVNTNDGKHLTMNFVISNDKVQVDFWKSETETDSFTGFVMGDGYEWSTGYSSKRSGLGPMPNPNQVSCHEDEGRLFRFVNIMETTVHDVKILKGGCGVLECPEKRSRWCMEVEVSESCPCQCQEIPVCETGKIRGWLSRHDLPKSCVDFFVSGMAHQHRDVCECMRALPDNVAFEMFNPECKFSRSASDTFFSTWRQCNY